MAHVVVKVARNAGLVALFIVAAVLGVLSGVMFAYAGDLWTVARSGGQAHRLTASHHGARRAERDSLDVPPRRNHSDSIESKIGELQQWTPTVEALVVPDIDASLDEAPAKTAFWNAFKALGPWWAELPPY